MFFLIEVAFSLRSALAGSNVLGHRSDGLLSLSASSLSTSTSNSGNHLPPSLAFPDRLLPRLPPFTFQANEFLPRGHDPQLCHNFLQDDIPIGIFRNRRLRRALGLDVAAPIGTPSRTRPPPATTRDRCNTGQFRGDFACIEWNAQALFCQDPVRRKVKMRYLTSLMARADVVLITEAHGTHGWHNVFVPPHGTTAWWSAGVTTGHAGVGIVVNNSFLKKFSEPPAWKIIWVGRSAKLVLKGPEGNLEIIVAYFPTGAEVSDTDRYGSLPRSPGNSFPELRQQLRLRIANNIANKNRALTILAGDFNYVPTDADRMNLNDISASGRRDKQEEAHFQATVAAPHGLHEMTQHEFTFASRNSRARLDRFYANYPASEQLDRHFRSAALEWRTDLSMHRAVQFSRRAPQHLVGNIAPISDKVLADKDFPRKVALEFDELCKDSGTQSSICKLLLFKDAIRNTANNTDKLIGPPASATTLEDKLGITLKLIRAIERGLAASVSSCLTRFPELAAKIANPYDFDGNLTVRLQPLRDFAIHLARDHALEELRASSVDLQKESTAQNTRQKNERLLSRLAPGRTACISAVRNTAGEIRSDTEGMVKPLRDHWKETFRKKGVDRPLLNRWIREGASEAERCTDIPDLNRNHIKQAIDMSKNTSPGPDGIPFLAWKRLKGLASTVLFDAFGEMTAEGGEEKMRESYATFNDSLLFFLPKKAPSRSDNNEAYYEPGGVRPLNVTNTDNRLLASAVRLVVETSIAGNVSQSQRGFIAGRSMVANLIDVDEEMANGAMDDDESGAIFFDFAAAFPSVEHEFLEALFGAQGWPRWLLRFIAILYMHNLCFIVLGGERHEGFLISRGIRQGCPLSPLLFAVASDLLLRRLERLIPGACSRAYADDLAVINRRIVETLGTLGPIFEEYGRISGLWLSIPKTILVPLFEHVVEELRLRISAAAPELGGIGINNTAKYLGVFVGPGKGTTSWNAPLTKFDERSRTWGSIGAGMFVTLQAYQVYVASVLSFVGQLEPLPPHFKEHETKAVKALFPGPTGWMSPAALKSLKTIGFQAELPDLGTRCTAAQARTYRHENAAQGGLKIRARHKALVRRLSAFPPHFRWRGWIENNFIYTLNAAAVKLKAAETKLCTVNSILHRGSAMEQQRIGWQARANRILRDAHPTGDLVMHLRKRLDRWHIDILPGHRVARAVTALSELSRSAPPRVFAAVLRALCNGWATSRRFQGNGSCCFGCVQEDSIEHYAFCKVFHRLSLRHLGLPTPPVERRLADFLCLDPCTAGLQASLQGGDEKATARTLRGLSTYCLHRTINAIRHGTISGALLAEQAFAAFVTDAASGHKQASALMNRVRTRAREQ
jgi:exonuclease III